MSLKNFIHIYKDHGVDKTLVLLHGTGADEYDLLPLVDSLKNDYNFLSLRGNVVEHGMNRFFARKSMHVFDEDSIKSESEKLKSFITSWRTEDKKTDTPITWLGYSNGANMILAHTLLYPENVTQAVLLHPMMPLESEKFLDLSAKRFLVSYGENDQMIPAEEATRVIDFLFQSKASVESVSHSGGHEIRPIEVSALVDFLGTKQ